VGYNFGVGREAPTFTLSAVDGNEINLNQYRGDWFPVLAFVPLGAPAAEATLTQLSSAADTLWGLHGQIVGICDAGRDEVKKLADAVPSISFPLLPDDGRVARAYGALKADGELRAMAFILDRAGKIVWTGEGPDALEAATLVAAFREVVR
jgi:peroxiredoxin